MSALHASVLSAFKSMGWAYHPVPDQEVLEAAFEAHHGKIPLHVQSFDSAGMINIVSTASFPCPATHRLSVCELLMRTNKELTLGNFELEWDSGQILFRVTNVFPSHRYDQKIIAGLIHNAIAEMDRLTPFLGEVCKTPAGELMLLRVPELLQREDLLPPPLDVDDNEDEQIP